MGTKSTLTKGIAIFISLSSPLYAMEGAPKIRIDPYAKIAKHILPFLPFEDFLRARLVSNEWHQCAEDDSMWEIQKCQTKKEWLESNRTGICKQIASFVERAIEGHTPNQGRILLAGQVIHKQHNIYLAPLVSKVLSYYLDDRPAQDQWLKLVNFIMPHIGTYARQYSKINPLPSEEAGLMIIHPESICDFTLHCYAKINKNNKIDVSFAFNKKTEEHLNSMATEIAKSIAKKNPEKFVINRDDFQLTEKKTLKSSRKALPGKRYALPFLETEEEYPKELVLKTRHFPKVFNDNIQEDYRKTL